MIFFINEVQKWILNLLLNFTPTGDQPNAIELLQEELKIMKNIKHYLE